MSAGVPVPEAQVQAQGPGSGRARVLGLLAAAWLRLQRATWRVSQEGVDRFDTALERGERVIVVFWHGKYVPLFVLLRGRSACVFTSLSRRGAVIAELCRRFGYRPVSLPDHGGDRSLEEMRRALAGSPVAGIAADGPQGPYHVFKRGAIELASSLGCPLIPTGVAARRKRVLHQRWDRMELPRLFTRIGLAMGEAVHVPPDVIGESLHRWQLELASALERAERRARLLAGLPVGG